MVNQISEEEFLKDPTISGEYYCFSEVYNPQFYTDELNSFLLILKPYLNEEQYQNIVRNSKVMYCLYPHYLLDDDIENDGSETKERIYAVVDNNFELIVSDDFGEPEFSKLTDGPFYSLQDLLSAVSNFINLIDDKMLDAELDIADALFATPYIEKSESNSTDHPKIRIPFSNDEKFGKYAGTYAQEVGGVSDDFIDDALGGDPDAYWNID